MSQIAKTLVERPQGSLSSNIEVYPYESLKVVTLRNGKELTPPTTQELEKEFVEHQEARIEDKFLDGDVRKNKKYHRKDKPSVSEYQPRLPYPSKVKKDH